jgi:hypothetical protein
MLPWEFFLGELNVRFSSGRRALSIALAFAPGANDNLPATFVSIAAAIASTSPRF